LSPARRSSSCHKQTEISKRCATRNKRGNDEIKETNNCVVRGKCAMLGRRGSAVLRSVLG
jgi:hypothetical protein